MKICIIGIGRVGLPLAMHFASKGVFTYGLDVDLKKIELLKKGEMPFLEKGGPELLKQVIGKNFHPTNDFSKVKDCDGIILTLGTPVDDFMNPDFSQIDSCLDSIIKHLKENQVLILRSTVSPGSTEYVKAYIEKNTNLKIGINFYLAFCPERIAEGKALKELEELPEIVGGVDPASTQKAVEIFKSIKGEVYPTNALNAELLKLFTNMYRYINFAIANEFMVISEEWGANIYEIVELSNKNYARGGPKIPGFAAGPCLFKDGFFLTSNIPFPDLIAASWKINETLPAYLIQKAKKLKEIKGKKCAILGMAFKANNDDDRASLSYKIEKIFKRELAEVKTHDVYRDGINFEETIKNADFLIIATAHDEYKKSMEFYKKLIKEDCVIIDVWNIFKMGSAVFRC
ncbi:MAG: nucleotide sugar dehydrogenase [Candidatus Micrarchaeia archaeon]